MRKIVLSLMALFSLTAFAVSNNQIDVYSYENDALVIFTSLKAERNNGWKSFNPLCSDNEEVYINWRTEKEDGFKLIECRKRNSKGTTTCEVTYKYFTDTNKIEYILNKKYTRCSTLLYVYPDGNISNN